MAGADSRMWRAAAVGDGGDRQGRVGADGAGQQRTVHHVQARVAEHLAVLVAQPLPRVPAHGGAAERVHGDHAFRPPQRVVGVRAAELAGDGAHARAHALEVVERRLGRPVDLEPTLAQVHHAVGDVAAHAEQRHRRRGQRAGPEQVGEVAAQCRVAGVGQVLDGLPVAELERPRQRAQALAGLGEPGGEGRVAGVLDVVTAPRRPVAVGPVNPVGHPDGAGDDRPGVGRQVAAQAVARRVHHEPQQVAVAGEAGAERPAQPGERRAVAEQQVRRPERARRQHQALAADGLGGESGRGLAVDAGVDDVRDLVAAALVAAERPEALDLVTYADVGARVLRGGQVRVVEAVLGAVVAAEVALADQGAGGARQAVDVAVRRRLDLAGPHRLPSRAAGEAHRERRQRHREPRSLGGLAQGVGLDRVGVRVGRGADHRLDGVVVRLEVGTGDRPVLVTAVRQGLLVHEPLLVLAEQDVGVDQ